MTGGLERGIVEPVGLEKLETCPAFPPCDSFTVESNVRVYNVIVKSGYSLRRYSTQRFEKLCSSPSSAPPAKLSSGPFPFTRDMARRREEPMLILGLPGITLPADEEAPPTRCRPAFSRSSSDHDNMEDSNCSISKRFASALGVLKNVRRTLVTKRRSTLFSD